MILSCSEQPNCIHITAAQIDLINEIFGLKGVFHTFKNHWHLSSFDLCGFDLSFKYKDNLIYMKLEKDFIIINYEHEISDYDIYNLIDYGLLIW